MLGRGASGGVWRSGEENIWRFRSREGEICVLCFLRHSTVTGNIVRLGRWMAVRVRGGSMERLGWLGRGMVGKHFPGNWKEIGRVWARSQGRLRGVRGIEEKLGRVFGGRLKED